jgi:GMP synthase (glutamine-hydrolysing)
LHQCNVTNANVANDKGICGEASSPRTRITKMLCETTNPEEKRKIIRDDFVKVANEAMTEMGLKPRNYFPWTRHS